MFQSSGLSILVAVAALGAGVGGVAAFGAGGRCYLTAVAVVQRAAFGGTAGLTGLGSGAGCSVPVVAGCRDLHSLGLGCGPVAFGGEGCSVGGGAILGAGGVFGCAGDGCGCLLFAAISCVLGTQAGCGAGRIVSGPGIFNLAPCMAECGDIVPGRGLGFGPAVILGEFGRISGGALFRTGSRIFGRTVNGSVNGHVMSGIAGTHACCGAALAVLGPAVLYCGGPGVFTICCTNAHGVSLADFFAIVALNVVDSGNSTGCGSFLGAGCLGSEAMGLLIAVFDAAFTTCGLVGTGGSAAGVDCIIQLFCAACGGFTSMPVALCVGFPFRSICHVCLFRAGVRYRILLAAAGSLAFGSLGAVCHTGGIAVAGVGAPVVAQGFDYPGILGDYISQCFIAAVCATGAHIICAITCGSTGCGSFSFAFF